MTVRVRSAIQAIPAYKPGKAAEQSDDTDAPASIKLSSNESPFAPIPAVREAMIAAVSEANRYPDNSTAALREGIARSLGVAPAEVAVGCGSSGLLQQIFLSYIDAGDEVIYPWRSFEVYPIYTQMSGGVAVTPALVNHAFDLESVASAISARTKIILLATPNNPTGSALTPADVRAFVTRVSDDILVVVDEAYKEFMEPEYNYSVSQLINDFPNVVVLRTFSKAHGLAGIRVGYAMAQAEIIEGINKTLLPFSVNVAAQAGALAAIEAAAEVERNVSLIIAERRRVRDELNSQGWNIPDSQGNFLYLPLGDRTLEVYASLEAAGIITRPFAGEGLRITIGTTAQNDRVLSVLGTVRA